jgi:hypothetical protein
LTIYIEQGNECWGAGDPHKCGNYAQSQGMREKVKIVKNQNLYSAELQARICYHAKMGKYYFDIFKKVFGVKNRYRLKLVLGTQVSIVKHFSA